MCSSLQTVLCSDQCEVCDPRRFINCDKRSPNGKLLLECWSKELNGEIPFTVNSGSGKKYHFQCDHPDCKYHTFTPKLYNITKLDNWCPYCCLHSRKLCDHPDCKYCSERSFENFDEQTENGKPKKDCWNLDKNNGLTPRNVFKHSPRMYFFDCDVCHHTFEKSLECITYHRRNSWCQYCAGKKLCGKEECNLCFEKSLASFDGLTPSGNKVIDQWDYEKNNINPIEVFKCATKKYYFKCDKCVHSFSTTGHSITIRNSWCSYCSSNRLCEDTSNCNDCFEKVFASYKGVTSHGTPQLLCWDHKKNGKKTPFNTFTHERTKIHFHCLDCDKPFISRIGQVTNKTRKSWCPNCYNKTETKLFNWLLDKFQEYEITPQPKYDFCKNSKTNKYLPFDFSIEELKLIIELDGCQHFIQVRNWTSPEKNFQRDKYKMAKAIKQGYSIIRILQKDVYNDKNNWEEELEKVIKQYKTQRIICIGCNKRYKKFIKLKINKKFLN